MPKYQGVKICKKEQYQVNQGFLIVEQQNHKKHWITNWTEKKQYYWWMHCQTVSLRQWNGRLQIFIIWINATDYLIGLELHMDIRYNWTCSFKTAWYELIIQKTLCEISVLMFILLLFFNWIHVLCMLESSTMRISIGSAVKISPHHKGIINFDKKIILLFQILLNCHKSKPLKG